MMILERKDLGISLDVLKEVLLEVKIVIRVKYVLILNFMDLIRILMR